MPPDARQHFFSQYGITDMAAFEKLYEVDEMMLFLPPQPTPSEKEILLGLIGTLGETYGYMDYVKSNNTFELIMQWREATGNFGN